MSNISPLLNIFIKSIREIRKIVIRDFNEIEKLQSSLKNNYAFEQKSFHKTQEEITNILKKIKPNYEILENSNIFEKNCWVVDYRDYKFNFSRANDNLGIGVSLITENNLDLFVFYNPVKDEIFFFDKGQGAFKNDSRIRVSHRSKRNEIVVSVHKKLKKDDDKKVIKFLKNTFYENSLIQRETGSLFVDLCDLASGKIDCMIFSNPNEQIKLVVNLILSESGGNVNLLEHMNSNIYITGNNLVGKTIKEMIEINIKNDESFD